MITNRRFEGRAEVAAIFATWVFDSSRFRKDRMSLGQAVLVYQMISAVCEVLNETHHQVFIVTEERSMLRGGFWFRIYFKLLDTKTNRRHDCEVLFSRSMQNAIGFTISTRGTTRIGSPFNYTFPAHAPSDKINRKVRGRMTGFINWITA